MPIKRVRQQLQWELCCVVRRRGCRQGSVAHCKYLMDYSLKGNPALIFVTLKANLSFRGLKVQPLEFISKVNGFWVVSQLGVKGQP